jgi:hypothetical protein
VGTSVNNSTTLRRRVGIGTGIGLLLALAPVPLTVAAASSGGSSTTASGVVTNVTEALTAQWVSQSDYVSSGWAISMSGKHPAATVQLTNISATIPLSCQVDNQRLTLVSLALRMPDASQSFTANDTAWHPTSSAADAHGYQVSVPVGDLCHNGALTPHGNATYTAKLVSTDTTDVFAVRFHTVDARTNKTGSASNQVNANTDCTSTQNPKGVAQCLAAWTPLTTSAATAPAVASVKTVVGLVTNVTKGLTAQSVSAGDYISSGWAISMPGNHPATTVQLTNISATIPLTCQVSGQPPKLLNLVVPMPDASQSFTANDTTWHPTSSTAGAQGYQASVIAGDLCHAGALTPHGSATYTANLASSDIKDLFAVRFHAVDARTSTSANNLNTDCASPHNNNGFAQCTAAWTVQTTSAAVAAVVAAGGGSGGTVGGIVASIGNLVTLPAVLQPVTALLPHRATGSQSAHPASGTAASASTAGAVSGATTQPAPVLVLPAPSQSTVLGPVPLPVPVIDSVTAGVGGALPWKWFLLLAILDLGLIVGIVIRRRSAQRDRLSPQ